MSATVSLMWNAVTTVGFLIVHPITIVGFVIAVLFWRRKRKRLALISIPALWMVFVIPVISFFSYKEWKNDLNRKDYIALNYTKKVNINSVDADLKFIKLITAKNSEDRILMVDIDVDPSLISAGIRHDCIDVKLFGKNLGSPRTYHKNTFHKGFEPVIPANPDFDYPIIWSVEPFPDRLEKAFILESNIEVDIYSYSWCHTPYNGWGIQDLEFVSAIDSGVDQ